MSVIKNFLIGQVEFRVDNLPQSCLNKLRSFQITKIRLDQQAIIFQAPLVHAAAIEKLINNFEYQTKENHNIFRGINFLLNHLVLVFSTIIALIFFLVADMGIYFIQVKCDDPNLTPAVYQHLDQLGIKKMTWKSRLQKFDLATDLISNFDSLAHAHVEVAGNTLVIDLVSASSQSVKKKTNFYAKYDAVIKEITTYSGTPMVNVGDVVKKGDLLVANAYPDSVVVTGEVAFVNGEEISRLVIWII